MASENPEKVAVEGFLQQSLSPFVIIARVLGFYSGFSKSNSHRLSRLSHFLGIFQTCWCFFILFNSAVCATITIQEALKKNSCKIGAFLNSVSLVIWNITGRVCFLSLIINVRDTIEVECIQIDIFIRKYLSSRTQIVLKISLVLMTTFIAASICLLFEATERDATPLYKMLSEYFPSPKVLVTTFSLMMQILNNLVYAADSCGQVLIVTICLCLSLCFKRVGEKLPFSQSQEAFTAQTDHRGLRYSNCALKVSLMDHAALCDLVERIDRKFSLFLFSYMCNDTLFLLCQIFRSKFGDSYEQIFLSFVSLYFLLSGMRIAALVHLSDQVRQKNYLKRPLSSLHSVSLFRQPTLQFRYSGTLTLTIDIREDMQQRCHWRE